jgi:hypothetical protein
MERAFSAANRTIERLLSAGDPQATALSPMPAPPTPEEVAADALDLAFWNSVKDSQRREELQACLEQHPNGHFAELARARLSSSESI